MRTRVFSVAFAAALLAGTGTAWSTSLTFTSHQLGAAQVTSPVMFPTTITIANGAGGTVGKAQNGDVVTFVFSQQIDEPTLCSGWANTSSTQSVSQEWSVVPGTAGGNDLLSVTNAASACTSGFNIGTVDLGSPNYNTGGSNVQFKNSTTSLTVGASTTTLTVTLGGIKGSGGTVASGNRAVWTPSSLLEDRSGRTCGANLAQSTATVQF